MSSAEVLPFSQDVLFSCLSNSNATSHEISSLRAASYLFDYLSQMGAKTVVAESSYTDGDFLDDYTAYYARCFSAFGRRCRRLHFFRNIFTLDDLTKIICQDPSHTEHAIQAGYLGFVVVRPLPQTVIGRTVLKTFDDDNGSRRHFPVSRDYKVNLFGLDLRVHGLAYQQQDQVIAACATVALWSAFHKTGQLFGTSIPTPAVITRAATQASHYGRPIPQHGLRIEEMCSAIRHNGLEPEAVNLQSTANVPLPSLLYGYLKMGLPAILIAHIADTGWHGITLTGYSLLSGIHSAEEVPGNPTIAPMIGRRIDRFYGHDDQIGPNSRLIVEDSPLSIVNGVTQPRPSGTQCPIRFASSWTNAKGAPAALYPIAIAVPVYSKIRLTFLDVQAWVTPLQTVFRQLLPQSERLEWDIHLILSNDYKREIKDDQSLTSSMRQSILMTHHPRFWWRAKARYAGVPICDLLFDATGIAKSFPLSAIIWHLEVLANGMRAILDESSNLLPAIRQLLRAERYIAFLRLTLEHREKPGEILLKHLTN